MLSEKQKKWYAGKAVLVTGADGFIGSHLVAALIESGAEVSVTVHREDKATRVKPFLNAVEVFEGDLSEEGVARSIIQTSKPKIIFNAASSTNTAPDFSALDDVLKNTYGIAHAMLQAATESSVERFVQFGSIAEYGLAQAPFTEDMHEMPQTPYALGKVMATLSTFAIGRMTDMEVVVVRPAAVYGPGQGFTMLVPNLIKACLEKKDFDMNKGEQLRDFIFIDDLVEGILAVGSSENSTGEIFNLGSGNPTLVKEVATMVNAALGNPITINFGAQPYREGDSMEFYMDSTKAKHILGWTASTDIKTAIEKTIQWYRENTDRVKH
ncbi:MAG TPA: NAD(P)-dependent oxidoreductase [Candidatus Paceibacterota bacterium]